MFLVALGLIGPFYLYLMILSTHLQHPNARFELDLPAPVVRSSELDNTLPQFLESKASWLDHQANGIEVVNVMVQT